MHTLLMMPFSIDTKVIDLFDLCAKITFSNLVAAGGIVFHKHMYFFSVHDFNIINWDT